MSLSDSPRVVQFAETAALYAVMNGDYADAQRMVEDMLPNERVEFAKQLDRLRAMLTDRFGNEIPSSASSRVYVLDDEGRFLGWNMRNTD